MRPMRAVAVLALCSPIFFMTTATADPAASVARAAYTTTWVKSARGLHYVAITARSVVQGTGAASTTLHVDISPCTRDGCAEPVRYVTELPSRAFQMTDDFTSATLSTAIFGGPLVVRWNQLAAGSGASRIEGGGSATNFYSVTTAGYAATARVRLLEVTCGSDDAVIGVGLDAANPAPAVTPRPPASRPMWLRGRIACASAP